MSSLFFQVMSSHLTFLPHIKEAARDVISELHIASQLGDDPQPPFFVGVHVRYICQYTENQNP